MNSVETVGQLIFTTYPGTLDFINDIFSHHEGQLVPDQEIEEKYIVREVMGCSVLVQ